jgi:PAS domain S-box-containing protein
MVIDVKTLILFAGLSHLMQFLVFLHQYLTNKDLPGVRWWLMWTIAELIGFILILLRLNPLLTPAIVLVQDVILLAGTIFIYFGLTRFFNKKINIKLIILFFSVFFILHLFYSLIVDDIKIHTAVFNVSLSFVGFLNAAVLIKNRTKSISATANFIIGVFVVHGLIFAYRSALLFFGNPDVDSFAPTFFNLCQYIDAVIVGFLWTFGFIVLLNQKLNSENVELRKQFELIFNTSPDAALITRLNDGLFFDCNDGFTKLTGYTKAEMSDNSVSDFNIWANPDERNAIMKIISENGFCENQEALFKRKDGRVFTGLFSAKKMILKGIPHIISITRDISDKIAAQEKERKYLLELKELNTIKDKLFSILGHDLRSPFSTILGFSDELKENIHQYSTEEIETMVGEIHKSGENTLKLLENILNWAKSQTGQTKIQLVKTDLDAIIHDAVNLVIMQAEEKKIALKYLQPVSYPLVTDENIVNTVLRNILANAIKFTNAGGMITILTNETESFIEVHVSDNGIGMTEEIKRSLFADIINPTRYGTNNEKGTGLGLAICKELIERLGGTIYVDSEVEKGSTFSFSLPKNMVLND